MELEVHGGAIILSRQQEHRGPERKSDTLSFLFNSPAPVPPTTPPNQSALTPTPTSFPQDTNHVCQTQGKNEKAKNRQGRGTRAARNETPLMCCDQSITSFSLRQNELQRRHPFSAGCLARAVLRDASKGALWLPWQNLSVR